jgi:signal transduction histidine kinase
VALAAYRIVQEALANAARHAPGAAIDVEAGVRGPDFVVAVTNGPPTATVEPRPGAGLGQVGMRERAELLGGTLDAGPQDDGGYRVIAVLPLAEEVM